MMNKRERENVETMVRGMEPLPKAIGVAVLTPIIAILFFAVYSIVTLVRGDAFLEFYPRNVTPTLLILLGIVILTRNYGDWLALKITGQYNETTLARGMKLPKVGVLDRVKQFVPTMTAWKWLLLAWLVANAFDCLSTFLALHYGAQEANPSARAATNMYLSKWIGVIVMTIIAVLFQWKNALKLFTVVMWLVVLSNFAVLGMVMIQPSLAVAHKVEVSMPAYLIQLVQTMVLAVVLLWHRQIWEVLKKLPPRFQRSHS